MSSLILYAVLVILVYVGTLELKYKKLFKNSERVQKLFKENSFKYRKPYYKLQNMNFINRNKTLYNDNYNFVEIKEDQNPLENKSKLSKLLLKIKSVFLINNTYNIENNKFIAQTPIVPILSFIGLTFVEYGNETYLLSMLLDLVFFIILVTFIWYFNYNKVIKYIMQFIAMVFPLFDFIRNITILYMKQSQLENISSVLTNFINYCFSIVIAVLIVYTLINLIKLIIFAFKKKIKSFKLMNSEFAFVILYVLLMTM